MGHRLAVACRACGEGLPAAFLDLGTQPLANEYVGTLDELAAQDRFPLAVACCAGCGLAQLTHTVAPARLFAEYAYLSSTSDSWLVHAREMAEELVRRHRPGRVLEIASNDGYLLQHFLALGVRALGVEPARNVAEIAAGRGFPTWNTFFGPEAAPGVVDRLQGRPDLVVANNVLAHVPDVVGFLGAVRDVLAPGGVAVFEVPHLAELVRRHAFDTVYHEHVYYWSVRALRDTGARVGLVLVDVVPRDVHGGSLRVSFRASGEPAPSVDEALAAEAEALGAARLVRFGDEVRRLGDTLVGLVGDLRAAGRTVAAYGAPAKGNTLLNAFGLGREHIAFTVDRSPLKQGRLLPGTGIPVYAPEHLAAARPDYALLLPWNLRDEVVGQQAAWLAGGGRFLVPIPEVVVLGRRERA